MPPLFSIIIPTYNRRESLRLVLHSLARQTISKNIFEVIVVNNFPDIAIHDIIEEAVDAINIVAISEPNNGAHNARNRASSMAKGEYLLFIDDDCEALPSFLEKYHKAVSCYNPIIGGGRIEVKWDNPPPDWIARFEHLMGHINYGSKTFWLRPGLTANGGNLLVRHDFFEKIGGMEPDQVGKIILGAGDTALSLTANQHGHNVLWVGDAMVFHHQKKAVNAKINDLMRREFNNGIMIAYEALTRHHSASRKRMCVISWRLLATSIKQFYQGLITCQKHAFIASVLTICRIVGAHWFYFCKGMTIKTINFEKSNNK